MRISILGTGYVGLVLGTCLAELGHEVQCYDVDKKKIEMLKKGGAPIYEPGLAELLKRNTKEKRLSFTTDEKNAVESGKVIFICVGTPSKEDGSANLEYIDAAAKAIAKHINGYKVVVNRSTVPVGTAERVKKIIKETIEKENKNAAAKKIEFDVVSNPEFLREGAAVKDFFNPQRTIIGVESRKAEEIMKRIFKAVERTNSPIIITTPKNSELIKYASNSFLAVKISFINEIAKLCEKAGADVKAVARGMGYDDRIGPRFLQAGAGYGGSCFPKDVRALIKTGEEYGIEMGIIKTADNVNKEQRKEMIRKINSLVPEIKGKAIAVWGLAFKPRTDDMREAPSIDIIKDLQKQGAKITAFDPVAMDNAKKILKEVEYRMDPYETLKGCDALVIITEWDEFRNLDKEKIKSMLRKPNIIDGRNVYDPDEMKNLGFNYIGIGR